MSGISHRHGIINTCIACLNKGDKPKHLLRIWRLISLLITVYEIAYRIKKNNLDNSSRPNRIYTR